MAISTRYSSLADQITSSPSSHYIETPRKTASGNSCKRLRVIQRSDRKFGRPDLLIFEERFHSNTKENGLQKLLQKFRGDQTIGSKVIIILSRYSSLAAQMSSSPRHDSKATPRKKGFQKLMQTFKRDPTFGSKVIAILTPYSSLVDQTSSPRHQVGIPCQPQGKWL